MAFTFYHMLPAIQDLTFVLDEEIDNWRELSSSTEATESTSLTSTGFVVARMNVKSSHPASLIKVTILLGLCILY
jgi:hypothetical protein